LQIDNNKIGDENKKETLLKLDKLKIKTLSLIETFKNLPENFSQQL
jgi:hypothetical protein